MYLSKILFKATHSICDYAMLSFDSSFYLFGGKSKSETEFLSIIGRLDLTTKIWNHAGNLKQAKIRHAVALIDSSFIVVGSSSAVGLAQTEKCTPINRTVTCANQSPPLSKYSGPKVFIVPLDYCE